MVPQHKNYYLSPTSLISEASDKNSTYLSSLTPELFKGFLGDLFNSLPEGILIIGNNKEALFINEKMIKLWEIPESLSTSQELLEAVIHQVENPEMFLKRVHEIYADKYCESQETVKLTNNRIYQRNTKPLIINNEYLGRFWTYRDITKESQTEQALRENEAKYRVLYDNEQRLVQRQALLDQVRATVASDLDLSVLFQNIVESISDAFGYTLVSLYLLQGNKLQLQYQVGYDDIIEEVPITSSVSGKVILGKKPIFIEDVSEEPNFIAAIEGVMSEICVPLFDKGNVVGTLNIESLDNVKLTESDLDLAVALSELIGPAIGRAHLYTEIKTQEQQLKNIFDLAPIGFILCNLDGTFVQVNKAFENTIGYSQEELLGLKFIDITHSEERANNLRWVNQLIAGDITTYGFEKRYIHKDGSFINVFLQVSLLPTQSNQPAQLIAQVVDLTDLKKAESALLQHQKMESIGVLAGGIAHDFNNLLVALKAQSSLALLKLPAESAAKMHIEKVKMAADSATQLTEQLLAYSGQGQFKIEQTNPNHEVSQNSELLMVAIPKNVKISNQLAHPLPTIMVDKGQFQQILMNLIINAAESMEGNEGTIQISTLNTHLSLEQLATQEFILIPPAPGQFVEISIMDDGLGMGAETLQKIFDPFFTTKFTGRGLGLAAVLGIVRSHNGGLIVKSKVGSGTTFKVYFPVAATPAQDAAEIQLKEQTIDERTDYPTSSSSGSRHVLLIDDDRFVRETIIDLFEMEEISILCAANGSEGITQLQEHRDKISVILLDLSMPGISSQETFSELRKINPHLPILLCSGFSELKVGDYFADKDYAGFIAKPFDIRDLIKTIREFL